MKRDQDLFAELVPIFLKYDIRTIENCLTYINENKQKFSDSLCFLSGNAMNSREKDNGLIDDVLIKTSRDKKTIIKRIYKYLSSKNFSIDQLKSIAEKHFDQKESLLVIDSFDKEEILISIVRSLEKMELAKIKNFEQGVQYSQARSGENNLENWSKVIVKE